VRPDREYLKRLLDAETAFWQRVRDNVWPGAAVDLSADPKWRRVGLRYREAKVRLETAPGEEYKLRAILERLATARRTLFLPEWRLLRSLPALSNLLACPELGPRAGVSLGLQPCSPPIVFDYQLFRTRSGWTANRHIPRYPVEPANLLPGQDAIAFGLPANGAQTRI
jgi:hypothetical protein